MFLWHSPVVFQTVICESESLVLYGNGCVAALDPGIIGVSDKRLRSEGMMEESSLRWKRKAGSGCVGRGR